MKENTGKKRKEFTEGNLPVNKYILRCSVLKFLVLYIQGFNSYRGEGKDLGITAKGCYEL